MRPNHPSTANPFAGPGAQLGYGRAGRQNTVHAIPSAHKQATTAFFIGTGEPALVETLKLSQRRLVLLLLLWWRVNCPLLIAGGVRPRCWPTVVVVLVSLVIRIA